MTPMRSRYVMTAMLAMFALAMAPRAFAQQTSEARIEDLVQRASARFAAETQAGSTPATPQVQSGMATGPKMDLTLDDAVKAALDRNLDIAVQRLNPQVNDIAVASAVTVYRPTITSFLRHSRRPRRPRAS